MSLPEWDYTTPGLVDIERTVQQAEQLVTRARTRFLAPTYAASEQQVRAALLDGGILPDRVDQYIAAWTRQLLAVPRPGAGSRVPISVQRIQAANNRSGIVLPGASPATAAPTGPTVTAAQRNAGVNALVDLGYPRTEALQIWGSVGSIRAEVRSTLIEAGWPADDADALLGPPGARLNSRPAAVPSGQLPPLPLEQTDAQASIQADEVFAPSSAGVRR
jgi:hypothetical protein